MQNKIAQMLDLQDQMNSKVNPDWRNAGNEWYRAIWIECAEMLDHHGWKWWKKQTPDLEQVQLELVDIFHFGLSEKLENNAELDTAALAGQLVVQLTSANTFDSLPLAIESLAQKALTNKVMDTGDFIACLNLAEMSFDELYRLYVGKNVLNFFRQDNGYKDGTYIKVWNGKEDNEVLFECLNQLDSDSQHFSTAVYDALNAEYKKLL